MQDATMLDEVAIEEKVRAMLDAEKFRHTLGVRGTAEELARRFGVDEHRARLAALVHDCARCLPQTVLLKMVEEFGILVDEVERRDVGLLHAPVGARLAALEFGVTDEDVLHAVRFHTTGCGRMSLLDKVIYLADYIEPTRSWRGVRKARAAARSDLGGALLLAVSGVLVYLLRHRMVIHPRTVEAWNGLLADVSGGATGRADGHPGAGGKGGHAGQDCQPS